MQRAVDEVLRNDDFQYLNNRFEDRRNPRASRLSYALSAMEDEVLEHLCEAAESVGGVTRSVYLFDGALVERRDANFGEVHEALSNAAERAGVEVTLKLM